MTPLNPTALEAAARALALQARVSEMEARGFNGNHASEYADEWWRSHLDRARHCLTAYLQALSAEGYGVVPRELTDEQTDAMSDAASDHLHIDGDRGAWMEGDGWRAGIAALLRALTAKDAGQ